MLDKIESIKQKLQQLKEELPKQNDYFLKLDREKEIVRNNINTLTGAIQAYESSLITLDQNPNESVEQQIVDV